MTSGYTTARITITVAAGHPCHLLDGRYRKGSSLRCSVERHFRVTWHRRALLA